MDSFSGLFPLTRPEIAIQTYSPIWRISIVKNLWFNLLRIHTPHPIPQIIPRSHYFPISSGSAYSDQVAAVGFRHFHVFLETIRAFAYRADDIIVHSLRLAICSKLGFLSFGLLDFLTFGLPTQILDLVISLVKHRADQLRHAGIQSVPPGRALHLKNP